MKSIAAVALLLITSANISFAQTGKKETTKKQTATYSCPMHPEVKSDKAGKCSKCGMDLVMTNEVKEKAPAITYYCPMHSDVISNKPGTCSKCGMDLVPKK